MKKILFVIFAFSLLSSQCESENGSSTIESDQGNIVPCTATLPSCTSEINELVLIKPNNVVESTDRNGCNVAIPDINSYVSAIHFASGKKQSSITNICQPDASSNLELLGVHVLTNQNIIYNVSFETQMEYASDMLSALATGIKVVLDTRTPVDENNLDYCGLNLTNTDLIIHFSNGCDHSHSSVCQNSVKLIESSNSFLTTRLLVHEILHKYLSESNGDDIMNSSELYLAPLIIHAKQILDIYSDRESISLNYDDDFGGTFDLVDNDFPYKDVCLISTHDSDCNEADSCIIALYNEVITNNPDDATQKLYSQIFSKEYDALKHLNPSYTKEKYVKDNLQLLFQGRKVRYLQYIASNPVNNSDIIAKIENSNQKELIAIWNSVRKSF